MNSRFEVRTLAATLITGLALALPAAVSAQATPATAGDKAAKPASSATAKAGEKAKAQPQARKTPRKPVEPPIAAASPEQLAAAQMVYAGASQCEFNKSISVEPNPSHDGYVDVRHGKQAWLMKPVLSATGALRLEDVRAETLMIQIGSKSMLLNQKTGRRIVDDCRHPRQLEGQPQTSANMLSN